MYRFRQFFSALTARLNAQDTQELTRPLTRPQRDLFRRMAPNDQHHSLQVCAALRRSGYDDPDLLAAALLHDVGKAAGPIWLWQRTFIVLLKHWAPGLLRWLARGKAPSQVSWWRRGFVVNRLHPELGARWAAEVGCSPTTVALIRRHQEPVGAAQNDQDRLLALLQWADGEN